MIFNLYFYIILNIVITAQEAQLLNERILILEKELNSTRDEIQAIEDRTIILEENIIISDEEKADITEYNCQLSAQILKLITLKSVFSSNGDLERLSYLISLQNRLESEEMKNKKDMEADLIHLNNRIELINADAQINTLAKYTEIYETHTQVRTSSSSTFYHTSLFSFRFFHSPYSPNPMIISSNPLVTPSDDVSTLSSIL